jgi:transposase-like protein
MNLQTVFCANRACPDKHQVGKGNIVSHGKARQRCKCKSCGHTFSYRQGTIFAGLRTDVKIVTWVVGLIAWGCPVAAIVAVFEVDERTVADWMHRSAANSNAMSVNLSSARVRRAEWYLEGMRMGQKVGALLGYQFERGLHDNDLNIYLQAFRQRFPFELDHSIPVPADTPLEAIAARNVVDGQKLVQTYQTSGFPYGVTELNTAPTPHQTIVQQLVKETAEALDAVADLALAEGVFQVSAGNHERGAAMLDALNRGGNPPEAEFIRTPRSGISLAHVVGAVFPEAVPGILNWIDTTPRAETEPRLNAWVDHLLGIPSDIRGQAKITDHADVTFTAAELNLSALDFLIIAGEDLAPGSDLERRILFMLRRREGLDDTIKIVLNLIDSQPTWATSIKTFFQMLPLVRALRRIVSECRPLNADDLLTLHAPIADDKNRLHVNVAELQTRANAAQAQLKTINTALTMAQADALITDDPADVDRLRDALINVTTFGLPDFPSNAATNDAKGIKILSDQADGALKNLATRLDSAQSTVDEAAAIPATDIDDKANALRAIINAVFGSTLNVLPLFTPHNAPELTQSLASHADLLKDAPLLATDTWLHSLTRVRERIARLEEMRLFSGMFDTAGDTLSLTVMQTCIYPAHVGWGCPSKKFLWNRVVCAHWP